MQLYFNNGMRVSIQHPSYNKALEKVSVGEVGVFTDDDIIIYPFHSGEDLLEILTEIKNR